MINPEINAATAAKRDIGQTSVQNDLKETATEEVADRWDKDALSLPVMPETMATKVRHPDLDVIDFHRPETVRAKSRRAKVGRSTIGALSATIGQSLMELRITKRQKSFELSEPSWLSHRDLIHVSTLISSRQLLPSDTRGTSRTHRKKNPLRLFRPKTRPKTPTQFRCQCPRTPPTQTI